MSAEGKDAHGTDGIKAQPAALQGAAGGSSLAQAALAELEPSSVQLPSRCLT